MAFRVTSKADFSPKYFTPAVKPRFKPRLGGRITPFGIEKTRIKPRILPTPLSGLAGSKPRIGGFKGPAASTQNLLKQTHSGAAAAVKPASQRQPSGISKTGPKAVPSGIIKPPASTKAQQPGYHISGPKQMKMKNKARVARSNPLHVKKSLFKI